MSIRSTPLQHLTFITKSFRTTSKGPQIKSKIMYHNRNLKKNSERWPTSPANICPRHTSILASSASATTRTKQCPSRWPASATPAEIQVTLRWVRSTLRTHSLHRRHTLGTQKHKRLPPGGPLPPSAALQGPSARRPVQGSRSGQTRHPWGRKSPPAPFALTRLPAAAPWRAGR